MANIIRNTIDNLKPIREAISNSDTADITLADMEIALFDMLETISDNVPVYIDNTTGEEKQAPLQRTEAFDVELEANRCWQRLHGNTAKPDPQNPAAYSATGNVKYWQDRVAAIAAKADEEGWNDLLDNNDAYHAATMQAQFAIVHEVYATLKLERALDRFKRVIGVPFAYKPREQKPTGRVIAKDVAQREQAIKAIENQTATLHRFAKSA